MTVKTSLADPRRAMSVKNAYQNTSPQVIGWLADRSKEN